jgi:hypothetical protein
MIERRIDGIPWKLPPVSLEIDRTDVGFYLLGQFSAQKSKN